MFNILLVAILLLPCTLSAQIALNAGGGIPEVNVSGEYFWNLNPAWAKANRVAEVKLYFSRICTYETESFIRLQDMLNEHWKFDSTGICRYYQRDLPGKFHQIIHWEDYGDSVIFEQRDSLLSSSGRPLITVAKSAWYQLPDSQIRIYEGHFSGGKLVYLVSDTTVKSSAPRFVNYRPVPGGRFFHKTRMEISGEYEAENDDTDDYVCTLPLDSGSGSDKALEVIRDSLSRVTEVRVYRPEHEVDSITYAYQRYSTCYLRYHPDNGQLEHLVVFTDDEPGRNTFINSTELMETPDGNIPVSVCRKPECTLFELTASGFVDGLPGKIVIRTRSCELEYRCEVVRR